MEIADEVQLTTAIKALKNELNGPRFRHVPLERAFIDWYVQARYGNSKNLLITDGPGDGGIDAIVTEGEQRIVMQFKYATGSLVGHINSGQLRKFEEVADILVNREREADFEAWINNVAGAHRGKYRNLRKVALADPANLRFDFVTSKRAGTGPSSVNLVDASRIVSLWQLYEEGFTPPIEAVEIRFEEFWSTKSNRHDRVQNYVGLADVQVMLALMEHDEHERLFAQNVRTDLKSRINMRIRETYEKEPDVFWLCNNGIYIVCSDAMIKGKCVKLVYPSIINGSQTLHALRASRVRHPCRVLVRVLAIDPQADRQLLAAIVKRTNSQNPMRPMNLAAHDPEQLNIARYLDGLTIFYERRQGEWKNEKKALLHGYAHVTLKQVAQWAAVTSGTAGMGTARARVSSLFVEDTYNKIFSQFGPDLASKPYRFLSSTVVAGLFTGRIIKALPKTERGAATIAHLAIVRAIYEAMLRSHCLCDDASEILNLALYRYRTPSQPVIRSVRRAIREMQQIQRRDKELTFANFFKRNDLTERAFQAAFPKSVVAKLRRALEANLAIR